MAKDAKLPVYAGRTGNPHTTATVDQEDFARLSKHRWIYDERQNAAYRDAKVGGKLIRTLLHREVLGCKNGDGKQVSAKDDDKLNCRKSNLFVSSVKEYKFAPKRWYRRPQHLIDYIHKNFPKSPEANFLDIAQIEDETYCIKKIVFLVPHDEPPTTLKMQDHMQTFFEKEDVLGFKGEVHVIRRKAEAVEPAVVNEKPVPMPAAAAPVIPITGGNPLAFIPGDASSFLSSVGRALGLGRETSFDYINFGVRGKDEVHAFSYERRRDPAVEKRA